MTEAWIVVGLVGAATVAIKAAGPVLLGGRELPPRVVNVIRLLAPALLAALIVTQAFTSGRDLVFDERALGVAAALAAVLLRAPMLVVVVVAAAVTAVARVGL